MNTKKLTEFFEEKEFNVNIVSESDNTLSAEIETWTGRGVNMIIYLNPFSVESFEEYIKSFDIEEEIEVHRQDERYKKQFTIRQSLEDFEAFQKRLIETSEELKTI